MKIFKEILDVGNDAHGFILSDASAVAECDRSSARFYFRTNGELFAKFTHFVDFDNSEQTVVKSVLQVSKSRKNSKQLVSFTILCVENLDITLFRNFIHGFCEEGMAALNEFVELLKKNRKRREYIGDDDISYTSEKKILRNIFQRSSYR